MDDSIYDSAGEIRKALENIQITAISLAEIDRQVKTDIIKGVLLTQKIPMLSSAIPIILSLASESNLKLIAKTAEDMIKKLK